MSAPEAAVAAMATRTCMAARPTRAAESLGTHSVETMFSMHVTTVSDISLYVKRVEERCTPNAHPLGGHSLRASTRPVTGTLGRMDWSLFHAINSAVASRDWIEDPVTLWNAIEIQLYATAIVALWFLARPYGATRWKLASASGLVAAAVAMITNQVISHLWERPRPFVTHQAFTHLLSAPSPDSSFPSDHAAVAFAIAFAVLAFSRRAGILFLAAATLISLSRIALGLHYPSDVLAGMLVGWAAAMLTTGVGRAWVARLVAIVSRISDPLLMRVWDRLPRWLSPLRR